MRLRLPVLVVGLVACHAPTPAPQDDAGVSDGSLPIDMAVIEDRGMPELDQDVDPDEGVPPIDCGVLEVCDQLCADLDTDPENCGFCGRTCVIPNAEAACTAGECGIGVCFRDFYDADGDPENGCELEDLCIPDSPCTTQCESVGLLQCENGQGTCEPPPEACNADDDDCDGACDEEAIADCRVGVHRGYGNGHLYTTDMAMVNNAPFRLEAENYFYLYNEPSAGMRPVFLCPDGDNRWFLSSDNACDIGRAPRATLGFWSPDPICDSIPLFRLLSSNETNHFYTTSANERDNAINNLGYSDRGIAGHVWRGP